MTLLTSLTDAYRDFAKNSLGDFFLAAAVRHGHQRRLRVHVLDVDGGRGGARRGWEALCGRSCR